MGKKRMIHALLYEDKDFGKLSDKARLLVIACMVNADDEGRLTADPGNLRAYAFRHDDMTQKDTAKYRDEISGKMENVKVYEIDGYEYMQFMNWTEYQFIRSDRFKASKIPAWKPTDNQKTTKRQQKEPPEVEKEKPKKELINSPNPIHRIMGYFNKKFIDYTDGFNYPMSFKKEGQLVKDLFNTQNKDENGILNLIDIFFEDCKAGSWASDKISIGIFKTKMPELLIKRSKEKRQTATN